MEDILTKSVKTEIALWLKKFPEDKKQSAIIPALTLVQAQNEGHLTESLIAAVADYLEVPKISVMEAARFYSFFDLKPVGRHKIQVCSNVSCLLNGCDTLVEYLQKKLGVEIGGTTSDGKFTLKVVSCLAACGKSPVMQIGKTYYENLTKEKIDEILAGLD